MQNNFKYINLSWAVVGICENDRHPLLVHIPGIDKDEAAAVEHYVIGYMAFWHIAFVNEDHLVPCRDDTLRNEARQKIDRYIAHRRPSARRDLPPLLPRSSSPTHRPDGTRWHEPRVSDVK